MTAILQRRVTGPINILVQIEVQPTLTRIGQVSINGESYRILDTGRAYIFRKSSGEKHTVTLKGGRPDSCTCQDWQYRQSKVQGGLCKHGICALELEKGW